MQKKNTIFKKYRIYEAESEKYPLPCPTPITNILSKALYADFSLIKQLLSTCVAGFTVMGENRYGSSHLHPCRAGQVNVKI